MDKMMERFHKKKKLKKQKKFQSNFHTMKKLFSEPTVIAI